MTLRHAAALALVGWYLVLPPVPPQESGKDARPPELTAPISQWSQAGFFQTADECAEAKKKRLSQAKKGLDAAQREVEADQKKLDAMPSSARKVPLSQRNRKAYDDTVAAIVFTAQSDYSQCIASDDPRLKK